MQRKVELGYGRSEKIAGMGLGRARDRNLSEENRFDGWQWGRQNDVPIRFCFRLLTNEIFSLLYLMRVELSLTWGFNKKLAF
jgi:hypothetical protein